MPQEVSGQKSELDGQRDDDDGGDDVEGDGAAAQRRVKVLHGGVRVREVVASLDFGRHLQTLSLASLPVTSLTKRPLPDSSSFSSPSFFRVSER